MSDNCGKKKTFKGNTCDYTVQLCTTSGENKKTKKNNDTVT